ncbi:MAG: META domain-containing protein [Pseudomonadota bacterium]
MMLAWMATGMALFATPDETISAFADPAATYVVTELAGAPFKALATLTFPEPGLVRGRAPCNAFTGSQNVPYPWIDIGPLMATKAACPDLAAENAFLGFLQSATMVEVSGPVLILTNEAGEKLVARAQ